MKRIAALTFFILAIYAFGPSHRHVLHFTEYVKGQPKDIWVWGPAVPRSYILETASAAYSRTQYVTATGASTFAVNSNFGTTDNREDCIGSGSTGGGSANSSGGGGGGAWSKITNFALPAGMNIDVSVGAGNSHTNDTWLKDAVGGTIRLQCDGGRANSGSTGGAGGISANSVFESFAGGGSGG